MDYELLFLKSLLLTIVIEIAVMLFLFRVLFKNKEIGYIRLMFTGFVASFATLPYLWFILPVYLDQRLWYIIIGESFAILMESFILFAMLRIKYVKSLLTSLICNAVSYLIGLMINLT